MNDFNADTTRVTLAQQQVKIRHDGKFNSSPECCYYPSSRSPEHRRHGRLNADDKTDISGATAAQVTIGARLMTAPTCAEHAATTPVALTIWHQQATWSLMTRLDILWRNSATGVIRVWMMDGTNLAQDVAFTTPVVDPELEHQRYRRL